MVLGLRTKTRKSPSVQVDYIIHIEEIKPWPPSQSLRTLRAVLIQWEHSDKTCGFTNQVVPSLGTGSGVGDGRIEFNESFRLPLTLTREMSIKGGDGDTFQKNLIEFNLYEPRRDKMVKGHLLGTAVLDLADYGIIKESLSVSSPINCKRTYRNTLQPLLLLKIDPVERSHTSSSSRYSLRREASMDKNHGESVSVLMNEEYAEEAENEEYAEEADIASFTTDDDVSSHSSLAVASSAAYSNGSSSPQNKDSETVVAIGEVKVGQVRDHFVAKPDKKQAAECHGISVGNSSLSIPMNMSCDISWISKRISSQALQSSTLKETEKQQNPGIKRNECRKDAKSIQENVVNSERDVKVHHSSEKGILDNPIAKESITKLDYLTDRRFGHQQDEKDTSTAGVECLFVAGRADSPLTGPIDGETREKQKKYADERRIVDEEGQKVDDDPVSEFSGVESKKQVTLENDLLSSSRESVVVHSKFSDTDRSKHRKSVRSSAYSCRSNESTRSNHFVPTDTSRGSISSACRDSTRNLVSDSRVQHFEHRIKVLEGELMEAAAMEVSLYSVVPEHGSSKSKVHTPSRRLSRLYFHKHNSTSGIGTTAKSVVSGLVLVAKACGNDVPRLTFWLSNTIVLRVIVETSYCESQFPDSVGHGIRKMADRNRKKPSRFKWESFPSKSTRVALEDSVGDWENPLMFAAALEKVESWIFSRIIESLWWQTFTPHMQSAAAKEIRTSMDSDCSKLYGRTSQWQGNFSLELWKKAFGDACERICPVRAGGHNCGCLPMLSKLIMEQLIARLDVTMFNAILRESVDDIPTDPVADPISDAEVLPIHAGKISFGAGAQLKKAIGNWSRWLTDLFGIDDGDDLLENNSSEIADDDERRSLDTSSKCFHLLNALSDLMMLPKDLLLSRTIRKEVCPTLGPPLIRRILNSFIPDEFCPDPIPGVVLEGLNSEDPFDLEEDCMMNFPCAAAPIVYETPSAASVGRILGEMRTESLVLKKSQTSDDELDEMDSPLRVIVLDTLQSSASGSQNPVRYKLLQQVWMNCG